MADLTSAEDLRFYCDQMTEAKRNATNDYITREFIPEFNAVGKEAARAGEANVWIPVPDEHAQGVLAQLRASGYKARLTVRSTVSGVHIHW